MSTKFWTKISNGVYTVGCTGQTVFIFDAEGTELARFKDLKYAYTALFSPDGKQLVVKSTEGRLAIYSLDSMALIRKFRFSKVNYAQDDGCCFSEDGEQFINVERYPDDLHSVLSWYDTGTFDKVHTLQLNDLTMITDVEPSGSKIYALGFERDPITGVADKHFIGIVEKTGIVSRRYINWKESLKTANHLMQKRSGFTETKRKWSFPLSEIEFGQMKTGSDSFESFHSAKEKGD